MWHSGLVMWHGGPKGGGWEVSSQKSGDNLAGKHRASGLAVAASLLVAVSCYTVSEGKEQRQPPCSCHTVSEGAEEQQQSQAIDRPDRPAACGSGVRN